MNCVMSHVQYKRVAFLAMAISLCLWVVVFLSSVFRMLWLEALVALIISLVCLIFGHIRSSR